MEQKFYICEHCGKIIAVVKESGVPVMCCGQKMKEIIPGTTEAATEKHIPVYTVENNIVKVKIGEIEHPMLSEHYIEWVSAVLNLRFNSYTSFLIELIPLSLKLSNFLENLDLTLSIAPSCTLSK